MTPLQIAIESQAQQFHKQDLANLEQFARTTEKQKQANLKMHRTKAREFANDMVFKTDEFCQRVKCGALHHSNKCTRAIFEAVTNRTLPKKQKEIWLVVCDYMGLELDDYGRRQAAKQKAKEDEQEAKEKSRLATLLTVIARDLQAGKLVDPCELLEVANYLKLKIHPRTKGILSNPRKVQSVGTEIARIAGRSSNSVCEVAREVLDGAILVGPGADF